MSNEYVWLWVVAIEPIDSIIIDNIILGIRISVERRSMLVVNDLFIHELSTKYGKKEQSVSTDGGGTWYPQACKFLKLEIIICILLLRKASSNELFNT